ncbi:MAG: SHOCT domain-containing protein [Chloroflexi bacterium]|nr:SHOCT domain-containing protein [Chloroflexota bacterium]
MATPGRRSTLAGDVSHPAWPSGWPKSVTEDRSMFRREMRREERRDVVEVAAVGGAVHEGREAREKEAELTEMQAQQAQAQAAAPAEAPAAAASSDLTDEQVSELERVAKLKEEGILSDEEFEAEKKKILGL